MRTISYFNFPSGRIVTSVISVIAHSAAEVARLTIEDMSQDIDIQAEI